MKTVVKLASHVHSSWSDDSDWSLKRLTKILGRCGFDGALICDHDRTMTEDRRQALVRECAQTSSDRFILVPGVEYQDSDHVVHLPVFGDVPFFGRSPDISDLLEYAHENSAVALMAHPARRDAFERFDSRWSPRLSGIEVWSRKYDGVSPNQWALQTAVRQRVQPWVALDFHGPRQLFPLAMRVEVPAPPTVDSVLHALRSGRSRATAFGRTIDSAAWHRGAPMLAAAEGARSQLAPVVRNIEARLRSTSARRHDHEPTGRTPDGREGGSR